MLAKVQNSEGEWRKKKNPNPPPKMEFWENRVVDGKQ